MTIHVNLESEVPPLFPSLINKHRFPPNFLKYSYCQVTLQKMAPIYILVLQCLSMTRTTHIPSHAWLHLILTILRLLSYFPNWGSEGLAHFHASHSSYMIEPRFSPTLIAASTCVLVTTGPCLASWSFSYFHTTYSLTRLKLLWTSLAPRRNSKWSH